jgi:hypothetical protein
MELSILQHLGGRVSELNEDKVISEVFRLKVPGGWIIYRDVVAFEYKTIKTTATFVKDIKHQWDV